MTETMNFGLDLGMGALKLHGIQQSIQLISQVAVNNGPLVGRMLGLGSSRLPLRIALPSGSTFFVDSGAHDSGRPVENLSMDRFAGSPEMLALFYGAFTRLILRSGDISQLVSITCGLPLDTLSGEEARTTVESIQRWMKADHTWKANDQEYHLNVTEVRVTSQPAGALFDYVLDDEGKIVPERRSAYTQEVGVVSIGMNTTELLVVREKVPVQRFTGASTTGVRRLLELVNGQQLYSLGELDTLLRANKLDISQALPIWEREVTGEIEKRWGKAWQRFTAVILVGGGAILLKNSLPYFFNGKGILADDPVQSIARGLWKLSLFQNHNRKN
jgi:hypothetical protein